MSFSLIFKNIDILINLIVLTWGNFEAFDILFDLIFFFQKYEI